MAEKKLALSQFEKNVGYPCGIDNASSAEYLPICHHPAKTVKLPKLAKQKLAKPHKVSVR